MAYRLSKKLEEMASSDIVRQQMLTELREQEVLIKALDPQVYESRIRYYQRKLAGTKKANNETMTEFFGYVLDCYRVRVLKTEAMEHLRFLFKTEKPAKAEVVDDGGASELASKADKALETAKAGKAKKKTSKRKAA